MKVLALDPSSSVIGFALMDRHDHIIEAGRIRSHDGDNWTIVQKVDTMLPDLRQTLEKLQPQQLVIEIPAPQSPPMQHGNRGQANYGVAVGLVIAECRAWARRYHDASDNYRECDLHFVRVDTWTRGQKKATRAEWIRRQFPQYRNVKDTGLDIADAIGLAQYWIQNGNLRAASETPRRTSSRTSQPRRHPAAGTLFAAPAA